MDDGNICMHHIHIVRWQGAAWEDHILFRDHMDSDPGEDNECETMEKQLAASHPDDRRAYTAGKAEFIGMAFAKARDHA